MPRHSQSVSRRDWEPEPRLGTCRLAQAFMQSLACLGGKSHRLHVTGCGTRLCLVDGEVRVQHAHQDEQGQVVLHT